MDGDKASIEARYSINSAGVSGRPAESAKEAIKRLGVISAGIWGGYGVKDHPAMPLLGFYEARFGRLAVPNVRSPGNDCCFQNYLAHYFRIIWRNDGSPHNNESDRPLN